MLNSLLYTCGWFAGIVLAAAHHPFFSSCAIFLIIVVQMWISFHSYPEKYWSDFYLLIYAFLIGFLVETLLINLGVIQYATNKPSAHFPPLWILLLYPLFSTTFNHSLKFINRWIGYPIILGVIAPLSYLAGCKMGACSFPSDELISLLSLAITWLIILPILVSLNRVLLKINDRVDNEYKNDSTIKMLYDNECPLCSREINYLKKSPNQKKIEFIDISAKDYRAEDHQDLGYQEAMKQLYAIDNEGKVLKGTEAFQHVYAKAGWKGLAIGMQAPLFSSVFKILYEIFARFRLQMTGRH